MNGAGRNAAGTLLLALSALIATCVASAAESVRVIESRVIDVTRPASDATHDLSLHAYVFRGTHWNADDLAQTLVASARLLVQCGISLASAQLHVVDAPRRFHYYETETSRQLMRALPTRRPALFFVEDTKNDPAFDAEAIGLSNSKSRLELANTIWVAHGARDLVHALAHELAHVLADSGAHSTETRNLMRAETAPGNDRLTRAQCDLIRSRGEANGLLARRQ
ncbi:MAG TPA: hypothetical protein VED01_04050 [Burkholderiales bacterium]|nr:hypothetical protein [Burkholderiales bacterium]